MAAPTVAEVRTIFDTNYPDEAITFWAAAADDYVTDALTGAGVEQATVDRITRLVACHFLAAQDPTESSDSLGDSRVSYEGDAGPGLSETRYGRRAIQLDPSGQLEIASLPSPTLEFYGTDYDISTGGR